MYVCDENCYVTTLQEDWPLTGGSKMVVLLQVMMFTTSSMRKAI